MWSVCFTSSLNGFGAEGKEIFRTTDAGRTWNAIATLAISLAVSQIRAEGEALGVALSEGVVQRLERYVLMMVGLTAPGALLPVLAILIALSGVTLLQRGWSAWRGLAGKGPQALRR